MNITDSRFDERECILVVDDEKPILDLTSYIMQSRGYRVITAQNAQAAFEAYEKQRHNIQAVMVDIGMPDMDGVELSHHLVGINPEVKIIVSSGRMTETSEQQLRDLGVKHFLAKPYGSSRLLDTVENLLHGMPDTEQMESVEDQEPTQSKGTQKQIVPSEKTDAATDKACSLEEQLAAEADQYNQGVPDLFVRLPLLKASCDVVFFLILVSVLGGWLNLLWKVAKVVAAYFRV